MINTKQYNEMFGMCDNTNKTLFKCIKTFAADPEDYGIDFVANKLYYGEREDDESFYLDSTENGTCVLVSNDEIKEYFIEQTV